jgi:hypothetical protein
MNFNDKNYFLLKVIYQRTDFLCSWSSLYRVENYNLFTRASTWCERYLSNIDGRVIYEKELLAPF